jgi:sporulation protein YlmC with PRC-barrel domain
VARLVGCTVFDPAGDRLGKVRDVVVIYRKDDPPRVVGLVVEIPGRRHVFLSIGRVTSIQAGQVITTGLINVRRFQQRGGEVRVMTELLGRKVYFTDGSGEAVIASYRQPEGSESFQTASVKTPEGNFVPTFA